MKTAEEIRTKLDFIEEDILDCMTMPCDKIEEMDNEAILEGIRKLSRINDDELIQSIETEAQIQKIDGYYRGLDYVALLNWINK